MKEGQTQAEPEGLIAAQLTIDSLKVEVGIVPETLTSRPCHCRGSTQLISMANWLVCAEYNVIKGGGWLVGGLE